VVIMDVQKRAGQTHEQFAAEVESLGARVLPQKKREKTRENCFDVDFYCPNGKKYEALFLPEEELIEMSKLVRVDGIPCLEGKTHDPYRWKWVYNGKLYEDLSLTFWDVLQKESCKALPWMCFVSNKTDEEKKASGTFWCASRNLEIREFRADLDKVD